MSENECMICFDTIRNLSYLNNCASVNCRPIHKFCFACLEQWFINNSNCPYDRIDSEVLMCEDKGMAFDLFDLINRRIIAATRLNNIISRKVILEVINGERNKLKENIEERMARSFNDSCSQIKNKLLISELMFQADKKLFIIRKNESLCTEDLLIYMSYDEYSEKGKKVKNAFDSMYFECLKNCIIDTNEIIVKIEEECKVKIQEIVNQNKNEKYSNKYFNKK